ncbi:MAG: DUF4469 domain-containing protein [Bacteroidota bacterium]
MKKIIKAYLTEKPIKTMKDYFVPVAVRKGKAGMDDIITRMKYELPFIDPATMANVIRVFNQTAGEMAAEGYNVDTGLVYLRAAVTGTNKQYKLDAKINKVVISAIPGKMLRKVASQTKVQLATKRGKAKNITYIDVPNQRGMPLREKGMVRIVGTQLKIMGEFPSCGIHLLNTETKETFNIQKYSIVYNYPKTIIFQLPDELKAGTYTLQITTAYCGTSRLLVKPVTHSYQQPVHVLPDL